MSGPHRAMVLLPAVAGVNDYMRRIAARLQAAGWATEIVDYFSAGQAPDLSTPEKILAAVRNISDVEVLARIDDAIRSLRKRGAHSVGITGYCIGGSFAMLAGARLSAVAAVCNYYGGVRYAETTAAKPVAPIDAIKDLGAPMIAHYGTADGFVPRDHVDELEQALQAHGKTFELFRYAGAPHAFDEDFRPAFRPVASGEAWRRTMTFMDWFAGKPAGA